MCNRCNNYFSCHFQLMLLKIEGPAADLSSFKIYRLLFSFGSKDFHLVIHVTCYHISSFYLPFAFSSTLKTVHRTVTNSKKYQ